MSTKRFSFSKGIISLMIMLVAVITLVACGGNTDQKTVDDALNAVGITYQTGDTNVTITKNITLPAKVGEVTVEWTSSNTAVISNAGVVTRGQANTVVSLTAKLTLGKVSETKVFSVTVLAAPVVVDPAAALAALTITGTTLEYNETTKRYTTSTDVALPATSQTLAVTWSTGNAAVISAAGVVVRPAWNTTDSTVILTATVGTETRDFAVTVLAITVKPASAKLSAASDALLLAGTSSGVAADITLPLTAGSEGVVLTWTSDKPESLDETGKVTRLLENVTVTLTATLTIDGESITKAFEVVVLSFAEFTVVDDLQTLIASGVETYVQIPGVTVVAKTVEGYMVYDGTAIMFVFTQSKPGENVVVGNVYTLTALPQLFNSSYQFDAVKNANMPTILSESSEAVSVLEPTVVTSSVSDFVANLPDSYPVGSSLTYQYVRLSTKIRLQGTGNYDTFLVDLDYSGENIDSADKSPYTNNAFVVYYKSNKDALTAFDGLKVEIDVFVYSLRTDRNIYTVIFTGEAKDITVMPLSDEEAVAAAKVGVVAALPTQQVENGTLTLPTDLFGTTIVWTSSDDAIINPITGVVTRVEGTLSEVTLTATISKGSVTEIQTVVVKVGLLPLSTIKNVNDADANSTLYRVRGTLVATDKRGSYYITDGIESLNVRAYDDVATLLNGNIGKEVEVIGNKSVYNGLRQLNANDALLIGDGITVEPFNVDERELSKTGLEPLQSALVEFTQMKVVTRVESTGGKAPNTYEVITITLKQIQTGKTIELRWDGRVTLSTETKAKLDLLVADKVVTVRATLGWFNNPQLVVLEQFFAEETALNDGSKVVLDAAALTQPATVTEAKTLSLPLTGTHGSTIVWTTESSLITLPGGAVAMPTEGQVTVTLTATLSLNAAVEVVTFEIKLGTAPVVVEEKFATYSFANLTQKGTGITETFEAVLEAALVTGGTDYLASVTEVSNVYDGNGDGGLYPKGTGLVKAGKSKVKGTFTLNFEGKTVSKVVIFVERWLGTSTDTLTVNGTTLAISDVSGSFLTFEFATPVNAVSFEFADRAFIFSIELFG